MAKRQKRKQPTRIYRHAAKLANGEVWYYATERKARAAQRSSWGARGHAKAVSATPRALEDPGPGQAYDWYSKVNRAEQRFLRFAYQRQLDVGRNGWPDFFCKSPIGGLAAVEVKNGPEDALRPEQVDCCAFLEAAGVSVYVFNPSWSKRHEAPPLIPWRDYAGSFRNADRPETGSGAQAARQATTSDGEGPTTSHANLATEIGRIPTLPEDPSTVH